VGQEVVARYEALEARIGRQRREADALNGLAAGRGDDQHLFVSEGS